jgi:hypothetical protein
MIFFPLLMVRKNKGQLNQNDDVYYFINKNEAVNITKSNFIE